MTEKTTFFRNWVSGKNSYTYGHLVKNNGHIEFSKLDFLAMFFWKTKNVKTLNLLLLKRINWKIEVSVSIDRKMAALSIFSEICEKSISCVEIFQLYKYQVLTFINAPTTRSDKFRICKVLIVKWGPIQFSTKFEKNTSCL